MNIAVYSGSFNPMHIGHLAILRHLVDDAGFDRAYLIVSPKNPLKDGISPDSGQERFNAAKEAVRRHFKATDKNQQKVIADDIELCMPEPHYTIRTLDALRQREPDNDFTLIIGADNLADIRRWKDYVRILSEYGVAVYPRTGFDIPDITASLMNENGSYRIATLDAATVDISSTQIREGMEAGKDMKEFLM